MRIITIEELKKYEIVYRALELACKQLERVNIQITGREDNDFLNHKVHGALVGYYLLKSENELKVN